MGQPFWNLFNRLDGCAREGLTVLFYGGSWRWRTASGNDDGQHTPMATALHTTRYDLQAGMVAESYKADGGRNQDGDQVADIMTGGYGGGIIQY